MTYQVGHTNETYHFQNKNLVQICPSLRGGGGMSGHLKDSGMWLHWYNHFALSWLPRRSWLYSDL